MLAPGGDALMTQAVLGDLAIAIAGDPEPEVLAAHLASVTFADLRAQVVTIYVRMEADDGNTMVLVGQVGLMPDEEANYTRIDKDFPLPAAHAVDHLLPYSLTVAELAERFPLLEVRPSLAASSQLFVPIPVQGVTVGALLVTVAEPVTWSPDFWHTCLAIQALLGIYMRATDRSWLPVRPLSSTLTAHQGLTDRQVSVLTLIAQDKSTSAIAARLGFSESTIKQDLRRAMRTLNVTTRQEAVNQAKTLGLITLP
jgi:DNA-binding CsgD family transcriptional regulator